jgi:hypothetical protein
VRILISARMEVARIKKMCPGEESSTLGSIPVWSKQPRPGPLRGWTLHLRPCEQAAALKGVVRMVTIVMAMTRDGLANQWISSGRIVLTSRFS